MARSIVMLAALAAAVAVTMPAAAKDKKISYSDFHMTKYVDKASPTLYRKKGSGGVKNQDYMTVKMNDALVSSRAGASGGPRATPLTATSSGLLQSGGGGTVGGGGATKVRQGGTTAH